MPAQTDHLIGTMPIGSAEYYFAGAGAYETGTC